MKKALLLVAAVLMVVSCSKKDEQTLRTQYEVIGADFEAFCDSVSQNCTQEEAMELIMPRYEAFMQEIYNLLDEHMGEDYSDSLFCDVFPMLEPEQKEQLVAKVTDKMRENETLASLLGIYEKQQATGKGKHFTEITAPRADGSLLSVSELVGKTDYVLVDFWASWCGPCRRLMPSLKELYAEFHPQGKLDILGVSVDQDEEAWLKAVADDQLPWHQVRNQEEESGNPADAYGVQFIPTTVLIDREGTIVARGEDEAVLRAIIAGEK